MTSTIEWTDRHDWNPVRGCTRVSPGCVNCYAETMAARFSKPGQWGHGFAQMVHPDAVKDCKYFSIPGASIRGGKPRWTGRVELQMDRVHLPLRWAKGVPGKNKCFITTTSDPFHESLTDDDIDLLFAVMISRPDWIFQVLTKRSGRMRKYLTGHRWHHWAALARKLRDQFPRLRTPDIRGGDCAPVPNVWLGVSVEDPQRADERIPDLLTTPAAVRFISAEPLLGPMDLRMLRYDGLTNIDALTGEHGVNLPLRGRSPKLDQVIVGGESGPHHRDNNFEANARSLLAQCRATGTAFFGKQNTGKRALPTDLQIREFPA